MGYGSQAGQVGFKTQASKGTYASPGGSGGQFMRIKSGSMGGDRELLVPDPEIGGNRDIPDAYLGPIAYSGEFEAYARFEALAILLQAALGNADVTDSLEATGEYSHTIVPQDTGSLPWLSVEEVLGDGYDRNLYTDCKVNTLHFEADANGYLMVTAGLIGLSRQSVPGASVTAAPNWDTTPMVVGSNITVMFNSLALPAKSFSFDISNNLEDDDFRLGSLELGDAVEKRREFGFGATIRPNDNLLYRQAVYGTSGAIVPGGLSTKQPLSIVMDTYENINATNPYRIQIDIGEAIIKPFSVVPSGDDVVEHDIEILPVRTDPGVEIGTFEIWNGLATIG